MALLMPSPRHIDHCGGRSAFSVVQAVSPRSLPHCQLSSAYLPSELNADLVLDFLRHPDLGEDLARLCAARGIPVVASGRKTPAEGVLAPAT